MGTKEIDVKVTVSENFEARAYGCEAECPFSYYSEYDGELTCRFNEENCPLLHGKA